MSRLLLFGILVLHAVAAAAQSGAITLETGSVEIGSSLQPVDIYRPAADESAGVAIVAHGFMRSRARHYDLGRALAEAGVTAVIPDLPSIVDHWSNGDAIVELVRDLEDGKLGLPPVERSRIVLIGTSAGGLATVLAAAKTPGIAGWIGLDPVDRTGTGVAAAAKLAAPAVVLLAPASGCNLFGSGRAIAKAIPALLRRIDHPGASHCDFEDPTNRFCAVACGAAASPERQARIRGETVDATLEMLQAR
jgi:dienelactone hydrolase